MIPKELRERRGLTPGAELDIEEVPGGVLRRRRTARQQRARSRRSTGSQREERVEGGERKVGIEG
jgi:bifunctional DNA-binding transcriptional regulator/antitoxin component of YhaV-PrlF toxin-antitoxin module